MQRCSVLLPLLLLTWTIPATTSTAASEDPFAGPVRILLLDYNAPDEHDVLLSHLCVERCTRSNGCPDAWIAEGVDYWSEDYIVFRPGYLGRNARFIIDIYHNRHIDLISFSGHHASGFSGEGEHIKGRFDTERLGALMAGDDLPSGLEDFFTHPSMVLLQGCRTDVKSRFAGDPMEYVLHVIEETRVRDDQFERLLAAVQQIGGVQEAYRDLFPNACLLGYAGTQAPGGRLEIFAQVHSLLRNLLPEGRAGGIDLGLAEARGREGGLAEVNRRIESQCRRGWPCNLCAESSAYTPLASNFADLVRQERRRIHRDGRQRGAAGVSSLETRLEEASYYGNTSWSCSAAQPGAAPVWPDPVEESPFGQLFLKLLWLDIESLSPAERRELREELVHRLGRITFTPEDARNLREWIRMEDRWPKLLDFQRAPMLGMSTFRQQDFYRFLANAECGDCMATAFTPERPSLLRENAARALVPRLGREVYRLALSDSHPRVRAEAARRWHPDVGDDLLRRALADPDPSVRQAASEAASADIEPTEDTEPTVEPSPSER